MLWFIIIAAVIALDQYTKYLALTRLVNYDTIPLIENVFHLTFVKNRGAAFGILQNQKWFFIVVTGAIMIGIIYYIYREKPESKLLMISLSMILGGAVGNLIDRIRYSYVVDFFDFTLINFPVFNVADSFVVVGTIFLSYYLLFKYDAKKDEA
ncbi:signal peptidase II [Petroclostridium sp. X23]|uniref:signal peptidase II n=1 Tax=Petroclostridium sp. X23 TaxID=3045146 RepID=UPI0024AD738E|nr:signal peptidase II [Petroclostridium sp. X23]WHH59543.1 signal peptidase II [Petroclostridium sp. X23]